MGTAIASLFAFFLVIGATMTAVNTVLDTGENNAKVRAANDHRLITNLETSVGLISATAPTGGGVTQVDVVLTNDGIRSIASFEDWDVTVRYDQTGAADETVLMAPYDLGPFRATHIRRAAVTRSRFQGSRE